MKIQHIVAASAIFGMMALASCSRQEVENPLSAPGNNVGEEVTFTAEAASPMEDPETQRMAGVC